MVDNRKVICAGCSDKFIITITQFYRNKRWCGKPQCRDIIDLKVKHSNYKKSQNKIKNGKFRHGVQAELREYIKTRDQLTCQMCHVNDTNINFQVHHITPVSYGGNDDVINLILLCSYCHTTVHKDGWQNYINKFTGYTNTIKEDIL